MLSMLFYESKLGGGGRGVTLVLCQYSGCPGGAVTSSKWLSMVLKDKEDGVSETIYVPTVWEMDF